MRHPEKVEWRRDRIPDVGHPEKVEWRRYRIPDVGHPERWNGGGQDSGCEMSEWNEGGRIPGVRHPDGMAAEKDSGCETSR